MLMSFFTRLTDYILAHRWQVFIGCLLLFLGSAALVAFLAEPF